MIALCCWYRTTVYRRIPSAYEPNMQTGAKSSVWFTFSPVLPWRYYTVAILCAGCAYCSSTARHCGYSLFSTRMQNNKLFTTVLVLCLCAYKCVHIAQTDPTGMQNTQQMVHLLYVHDHNIKWRKIECC